MTDDHILVSIPAGPDSGKTIRRAVEAVLGQTHESLTLVVTSDGDPNAHISLWPQIEDIDDPRLVRFELPANRGRYYIDAVALAAAHSIDPDGYFTVHDADDQARPTWLATQLAVLKRHDVDAVFCTHAIHGLHTRGSRMDRPQGFDGRFKWHAHLAGLWRTDFIHAIGGPRPDFRVGYDTMLTGIAMATGRSRIYAGVLYDRYLQPTSLTKMPGTRMGSPLRRQARDWMEQRWPQASRAAVDSPHKAGQILTRDIPAELLDELDENTTALTRLLDKIPDQTSNPHRTVIVPKTRTPIPTTDPRWATALNDSSLWGAWALNIETGRTLARQLEARRPRVIVEAGSGTSTLLLSQYADTYGAKVISLEGSEAFRARSLDLLRRNNTGSHADIIHAPLHATDDGPWYTAAIPNGIDFAIVDGPRARDGGRRAALTTLMPRMNPGSLLVLDDTDRPKEQSDLAEWSRRYGLTFKFLPGTDSASYAEVPEVDARNTGGAKVTISLLTGRRPDHLRHTLDRLQACSPGLLTRAHVIALHNGGDEETATVLNDYRHVIDASWTSSSLYGIGHATSMLAQQAAASGRKYWLHLEDDWAMLPTTVDWLAQAQHLLHTRRDLYQVRLRHTHEKTLAKHMVTGRTVTWYEQKGGFHLARDAHYTLNPSLVRVKDIPKIWPADGERDAQKRAHANRLRQVARLATGVFAHTGDDSSLREITRCKV